MRRSAINFSAMRLKSCIIASHHLQAYSTYLFSNNQRIRLTDVIPQPRNPLKSPGTQILEARQTYNIAQD